jgi:hypothetical protein
LLKEARQGKMAEAEAEADVEVVEVEVGTGAALGFAVCADVGADADAGVLEREMDDGVKIWVALSGLGLGVGMSIGLVCVAGTVVDGLCVSDMKGRAGLSVGLLRLVAGRVLGIGKPGLVGWVGCGRREKRKKEHSTRGIKKNNKDRG